MIVVPSRMGRLNKRALVVCLHRMGTASRADLAKSLGLSQPTAGKIADELLELGVFEEVEIPAEEQNGRKLGRPARMLRLTQSKTRFLGIQLGLEYTSVIPLPLSVSDESDDAVRFEMPDTAEEWLKRLRKVAEKLTPKSYWGVLLSAPGLIDERNGKILYSPNLHWTATSDLPALVKQVWRAPVVLIQEERALALGHHSADPSGEDFYLVDFGEGVGGAVMTGGKLYKHPLPIGGELGHTPVIGNERRCGCGAVGCLETLTSNRGLLASFAEASPKSPRTWEAFSKSIEQRGVEPWLAQTLDATAAVIAGALNVLGVRRVVLTGSITELPSQVFSYISNAIAKGALWARFGEIQVEKAPRRRKAGLVAAGIDQLVIPMGDS